MATQHILPKANYKSLVGVVVNAGERARTVRVRLPNETWNSRLHKFFNDPKYVLVHDPRRSCETGDVISIRSNWRVSKHVKHTVTGIVSPFGRTIAERPPVMTEEERVQERLNRRKAKDARQAARGRETSIARLSEIRKLEGREAMENDQAKARLVAAKLEPLTEEQVRASKAQVDLSSLLKVQKWTERVNKIVLKENDFDLIKRKIKDVINVGLEEGHDWALKDDILNVLTLWVAYQHAESKNRIIGKDIPLLAGKSTQSPVIHEQLYLAEIMRKLAASYRRKFLELVPENKQASSQAVLRGVAALKARITNQWKTHVFETREADAVLARQENRLVGKVTSRVSEIGTTNWHQIVKDLGVSFSQGIKPQAKEEQSTDAIVLPEQLEKLTIDEQARELAETASPSPDSEDFATLTPAEQAAETAETATPDEQPSVPSPLEDESKP